MATKSKSATASSRPSRSSKQQFAPHKYQKRAVKFLLEHSAAALLLDPGLGKTSISYAALKVLKNKGVFKGALVLAPLRCVYSVWPKEQEKWADFSDFSVGLLHGDDKDDVLAEPHDIYVMNYESIEWLFGVPKPNAPKRQGQSADEWVKAKAKYADIVARWMVNEKLVRARLKLLFANVDTLIIDELSKMKHVDTKRFKSIKKYLGKFVRRWGLTGSPAPNGLMDLFGQCYCLDLGKALGPYVTHYRNTYFYPTGFGGYSWSLQEGADKKIYKAIKPLALRMEAEDYIDMPKVIPVTIYVDLPPAARKVYDAMEDELFAEIDGQEFVAVNAASASIKCQQIANGALYKDKVDPLTGLPVRGKREWTVVHGAKLEAMQELIDEMQGKPILWGYHFGHDLERIVTTLGKATPHMDVSPKLGARLVDAWNRNELANLFCHPASVGHGLNMQEGQATHVAYFGVPWDYEMYDQFIRRIRRQGNDAANVFVYHFVARDTVDEAKMRALANKGAGQKALLDALKSYRAAKSK
jgi:SNF2 family DNA or RNA helicase